MQAYFKRFCSSMIKIIFLVFGVFRFLFGGRKESGGYMLDIFQILGAVSFLLHHLTSTSTNNLNKTRFQDIILVTNLKWCNIEISQCHTISMFWVILIKPYKFLSDFLNISVRADYMLTHPDISAKTALHVHYIL